MAKHKQAVNPLAELHFISAVQLEEALGVIQGLVSPATPITLTELSEDAWQFEMWFKRYKTTSDAYIKGTLSRWQGTFTRVDCTGDVQRHSQFGSRHGCLYQILLGILCFGAGSILLLLKIPLSIFMGLGVMAFGVWGIVVMRRDARFHSSYAEESIRFRERDFLFQKIINAFRSAGQVSYDGSHLEDGEIVAVKSLPLQQQDK